MATRTLHAMLALLLAHVSTSEAFCGCAPTHCAHRRAPPPLLALAEERTESAKAGAIAAVAGSLCATPAALVASTAFTPQWEFATDVLAVQLLLFGVVYRYAVRSDDNEMLKQGAVGAFALVRTLTTPDGAALGPLWAGALNSPRFLRRCVAAAAAAEARAGASSDDRAAAASARAIFERGVHDRGMPPFSRATGHVSPAKLVEALRARGYSAARCAFDGDAAAKAQKGSKRVRTDAPAEVVREVMGDLAAPAPDGPDV